MNTTTWKVGEMGVPNATFLSIKRERFLGEGGQNACMMIHRLKSPFEVCPRWQEVWGQTEGFARCWNPLVDWERVSQNKSIFLLSFGTSPLIIVVFGFFPTTGSGSSRVFFSSPITNGRCKFSMSLLRPLQEGLEWSFFFSRAPPASRRLLKAGEVF